MLKIHRDPGTSLEMLEQIKDNLERECKELETGEEMEFWA